MGFMNWLMKGAGFETEEVYDNTLEKKQKKEERLMRQEEKQKRKAENRAIKAQKKAEKVAKKYSIDVPEKTTVQKPSNSQQQSPSFYSENPSFYNMNKYEAPISEFNTKSSNVGGFGTKNVEFIAPTRYEDVVAIIRFLKEGESIVLNLSQMNSDESQRLLDCTYGAMYALNGDIRQVDNNIFFITPEGFNIKTPTNFNGQNNQQ